MYQIFVNHNVENRKGKKHKSSQRSEGLSYELTETVLSITIVAIQTFIIP